MMTNLVRMRLLDETIQEIKEIDPHTAVTKNFIRQLVLENKIPCMMVGRKRLINFDELLKYLADLSQEQSEQASGIRKIPEKLTRVA